VIDTDLSREKEEVISLADYRIGPILPAGSTAETVGPVIPYPVIFG
jgi:hypothetical protein